MLPCVRGVWNSRFSSLSHVLSASDSFRLLSDGVVFRGVVVIGGDFLLLLYSSNFGVHIIYRPRFFAVRLSLGHISPSCLCNYVLCILDNVRM